MPTEYHRQFPTLSPDAILARMGQAAIDIEDMRLLQEPGLRLHEAEEALTHDARLLGQVRFATQNHLANQRLVALERVNLYPVSVSSGVDPKVARVLAIREIAQQLPPNLTRRAQLHDVTLTTEEAMNILNFHTSVGYYPSGAGVGREESAFITPLVYSEGYRQLYTTLTRRAFDANNTQERPFTRSDPFRIFILGDAEGFLLEQTMRDLFTMGSNINHEVVEIIVGDLSPALLERQKAVASELGLQNIRVSFLPFDARKTGEWLQHYPDTRGILLGEELVDAFPVQVVRKAKGTRADRSQIYEEQAFVLKEDGSYEQRWYVLPQSEQTNLESLLKAFPYYQKYLDAGRVIPINWGFLSMMFGIADASSGSNVQLAVILGDYTTSWQVPDNELRLGFYAESLRAMPAVRREVSLGESMQSSVRMGFKELADITADPDMSFMLCSEMPVYTFERTSLTLERVLRGLQYSTDQLAAVLFSESDQITSSDPSMESSYYHVLDHADFMGRTIGIAISSMLHTPLL